MNPKIDITILDQYGSPSSLNSDIFEPYEVYVNDERIFTSEEVEELEDENARLCQLCTDMHAWMSRALNRGSAIRYEYELMTECMDDLGVPHD